MIVNSTKNSLDSDVHSSTIPRTKMSRLMRIESSRRIRRHTLDWGMDHGRNNPVVTIPVKQFDAVPVGSLAVLPAGERAIANDKRERKEAHCPCRHGAYAPSAWSACNLKVDVVHRAFDVGTPLNGRHCHLLERQDTHLVRGLHTKELALPLIVDALVPLRISTKRVKSLSRMSLVSGFMVVGGLVLQFRTNPHKLS